MMKNLTNNIDPAMMNQMGGMQGIMNMAKSLQGQSKGGMPDMG
jgi:excinuclease UvrABC helicase subunit UvrB